MEMEYANTAGTEVLAFAKYQDLEKAGDRAASKIKEGFMEMGYVLKVARDTDILVGSCYANHEEFGNKRYGLDKGTVSRYIRIVERFSVGGDSNVLQEGYKGIGFVKLSLMLHMPDAVAEEITPSYSKQEVQEIKEEIDAEKAVSDIEVAIEDAGISEGEKTGSLLERAIRQLGKEQPGLYLQLHGVCHGRAVLSAPIMETLAPQGDAIYMARIPGTGRLMLSVNGESASVTNVRSGEKERYSAGDVQEAVMGILHEGSAEASWQQEYGEPMEPAGEEPSVYAGDETGEKGKVAPVQPKEKRKESKVVKAAPPKKPEKKTAKAAGGEGHPEVPEEPLPGQMEVRDYPEAYPEEDSRPGAFENQIPDVHYEEISEKTAMEAPAPETGDSTAETGSRGVETAVAAGAAEEPSSLISPSVEAGILKGISAQASTDTATAMEKESLPEGTGAEAGEPLDPAWEKIMDMSHKEVWEEVQDTEKRLSKFIWRNYGAYPNMLNGNDLDVAHRDALDLAAAIEKLMELGRL